MGDNKSFGKVFRGGDKMKCTEIIYDGRTKKPRACNAEIYGMTGLQELQVLQKHMKTKHKRQVELNDALVNRAGSGQ